jgi:selenocysteine-specific elongation factor
LVLGTAGHVDHGKTALVKALTGVDTDRLKEEKARGITIELGFAELALPGYGAIGLVDVPGHERFVRSMAAGAGGVDLVLLVIACDEGVMPQTREHLDICRLLGVRGGVVALTKSDLLSSLGADWLGLLRAEVEELTRGTFLEAAAVVPVSSRSGEGLESLRGALTEVATATAERSSEGAPFLPIDRAFTLKGFGTVVTGTLISGSLRAGEDAELLPGGIGPLRMRSLQSHGRDLQMVHAGQRTAVNLPGIEVRAVSRGMTLTRPGAVRLTSRLEVEIESIGEASARRVSPSAQASRRKLLCHLGTAQVSCAVKTVQGWPAPGERAMAEVILEQPIAALPGQRLILRGFRELAGRGRTVAGGRVLALSAPRRRSTAAYGSRPDVAPRAAVVAEAQAIDAELCARLAEALAAGDLSPPTTNELGQTLQIPPARLSAHLRHLVAEGRAVKVTDELYFDAQAVEHLRRRLVDHLREARQIDAQGLKALAGVSRKFCIPLGEYFDRQKVTLRVGEARVLRRGLTDDVADQGRAPR